MELNYIKERLNLNIMKHDTQEIGMYKAKLLDIIYLYEKYGDSNLIDSIKELKSDVLSYKKYINKEIDNKEYNYKKNIYKFKKLLIISLLFIILIFYEKEIHNILQINVNFQKLLTIINFICIISTCFLLMVCIFDGNYNEERKSIDIQLNYFEHLFSSIIYSVEKNLNK